MSRHRESNPHFLPRQNDPVIEFPSQTPPPGSRLPPHHHGRTSVEPPRGPRPQPPPQQPLKPVPPHQVETPAQSHQQPQLPSGTHGPGPQPHPQQPLKPVPPHQVETPAQSHQQPQLPSGRSQHPAQQGRTSYITPTSRPTRPFAWLVAAFCALFWVIVIVGGLIILIVYLVFRPRNPRFDISTATINAAYLDMGYLLNADITVLANFTNPNTKVNVDFNYVVLDLYYENNFITTRYIEPFSVMKSESRFSDVHMVASQVGLSMGQSLQLQRQVDEGRVHFEIRGLFRTRSKLGGILRYSYWLYARCQIVVTGPPTGVLIGKRCVTKR